MTIDFRNIDELKELMTEKQNEESRRAYDEVYLSSFGNLDDFMSISDEDEIEYLKDLDLENWD